MSQVRRWTFTLNNPDDETESPELLAKALQPGKGFKYLIFQLEVGANGTPHYQGPTPSTIQSLLSE